jgi:hypothetical protein
MRHEGVCHAVTYAVTYAVSNGVNNGVSHGCPLLSSPLKNNNFQRHRHCRYGEIEEIR